MPVEVWRTTYFGNTNAGQRERDRYRNDAAANLGVNTDDGSAHFGQRRAGFGRDGNDNTGTVVLIARDNKRLTIDEIRMLCDFATTFHDVARSGRIYRQNKGLPPDTELQEEDRAHMRYYLDRNRYMRDFESHKKLRKDIYERIARGDADEDVRNVARQRWQERLGDRVKEPRGDIMDICGETPPPYEREKSEKNPSFGLD